MSLYKKDEHGEYRVTDSWIRAWEGGCGRIAGFNEYELREYADGNIRTWAGTPIYVNDRPELYFAHRTYIAAIGELRGALFRESRKKLETLAVRLPVDADKLPRDNLWSLYKKEETKK